ncbi:MAG TPA: hypothetical protein VGB44_11830 [Flavobacterium sp.]|jgi:hypothetical protein
MIPAQFKKTLKLYKQYSDQVSGEFLDEELTPEDEIKLEHLLNPRTKRYWCDDLTECFVREYKSIHEKNIYFVGCKVNLYKSSYNLRLKEYLASNDEAEEIDFLKSELEKIFRYNIFEFAPEDLKTTIKRSLEKQTDFLERKLESLGYMASYDLENKQYNSPFVRLRRIDIPTPIESKDSSELEFRTKEKLITLNELGVLQFLLANPSLGKNISKISKILSPIINVKHTTLVSYLNPLLSESVDQKNNPYENERLVEKIKYILKDVGFKKTQSF